MKSLRFFFLFFFFSCNQEKIKKEFFPSGELKIKVQTDNNGKPNGVYQEYYKSGELRMKTNYSKKRSIDTTFIYYKNGKIKEKGILQDNLKTGWWKYYNSSGLLINKNEYKIINNGVYKNQSIHYSKKGSIIDSISSFYTLKIPDTLKLGKNVAHINYNSNFNADEKHLYIIIDNNYSDSEIKRDTFIEKPNKSRFGIFTHKKGVKMVKGTIIEQLLYKKKINSDSLELKIEEHKKYFEKEVYVKGR
ncbi:toxin-antitoxin system YwqK family antitoxin [Tenacibaculum maritimum]|uniref:toxin-antitoxin system YwqK family antitoxin n=2 Tax=Tenacibaculum maritimum TaxID=107401 RepID=UPI0012E41F6D|nr:hypothetical protein [Tenacibaculum maritimum]CAA0226078.1 conserved hypothetical protein [Tenacibaculum maritimum]